jgi:hypothetical protein
MWVSISDIETQYMPCGIDLAMRWGLEDFRSRKMAYVNDIDFMLGRLFNNPQNHNN